jgi:hypothetical protein
MNYDPNNILNSEETNFVKLSVYQSLEAENARLKAEVERLTKAGDAMASVFGWVCNDLKKQDAIINAWLSAKESKQSND